MKLRVFLLMMAAFFISQSVWAVPARPGFTTYHTADGTEVSLEMVGDEFGHWLQDKEGNAYHLTDDGTVTRSTQTVAQLSKARKSSPRYEASRHRLSGKVNLAPRGIVILVNYKNLSMQSANTQSAFNNMLNASGYNYRNTHNSVREYFRSQSKGQYVPDFDVYGPVTISQNYAYYGANNSYGDDMYPGDVVLEAVQAVKRQYNVDFTLYNNDGDDKVDFVYVIYAGKGEADSDAANTIWPHNSEVYTYFSELCSCPESYLMVDGLYINNYAMSGELDGYTGYRASIGTICHEFGHVLGLPDFYDTGNGSNRTNNLTPCYYDIMDSGSYSGKDSNGTDYCGTCPPNYSPWERIYLGWDTPVNPGATPANLTLYPVENSNYQCYQINSSGQYQVCTAQAVNYYIENRQQTGWDTYLPGHGMLVWRVDYNSSYWLQNRPNHSNYGSPHYTLVSAYGSAITSGANTYPGTKNVTSWTSLSTRAVTEITESGGIVTAKYMGGAVDRYEQELLYYTAVNNETANVSGDYSVYLYTPEGSLFAIAELVTGNDYSLAGTYGVGVNNGATYNSQIYLNGQYYEVTSGDITLTYQGKYTDGEDIYQVTATDWYVPSLDIYYDMYGTIYGNAVWKTPFVNCGYTTDGCDDAIIPVTDEFDNRCGDNLTWELSSDKTVLTIEGYGDMWDFTLTDMTNNTIPWKSAYTTIEQVILPDGITSIGDYAFFNHRQLTTISLPSSLTHIGMYAFARNAFSSIAIPDAVMYIGDYAFAYATNISSIDLPKNLSYLGTDVFINCTALKTVNYNAVNCQLPDNYDTGNPFYSVRSQITSFNIGNEVQVLPAGLCYKMTNISSVTLPLSLTTLNGNAFYGCSKLTAIAIPKNMNYIGKDVFAACSKLTSVIWNAKTCELAGTSTTNTPFRSICEQITSFIIGDDVETLPIGCCFGMTKLTSVTIPAQLKAIGVYCFHTCSSLKTVRFNSPTPPSATTSSFNGIPADAAAQVPCGAKPAYVASKLPFSNYTTFGDFIYTVTLAVQTPETGSVNWLFTPDCDDNSGVIEATPALHYHFVRWEDEAENVATVGPERTIVVTKDITYTAVFEADHVYVISLYTDGHGSAGADKRSYYAGETATLTATPDEGYDFLRWSDGNEDNPRSLTVTENLTLTAEFVKNSYIVTFVNYDGSELQTSEVGVGETPTYNGNEPSKPADDEYTYTFAGWADGENVYPLGTNLPEVTEDATYTAVYDDVQNEYMVIFQDEDGTVLESNSWYYGETPVYYGSEPTKEDNAEYSYYFAGWDKNIVPVTGDATYTAVYSSERNQYTITFQDEDGTVLQSGWWYYGETPVYNGTNPTKEADDEYTYYFAGWDKDIVAVTGDATYTAVYSSERNQYTITFQDEDGTELQSGLWYYGEMPVYNGTNPTKEADDEYTYTFAGWADGENVYPLGTNLPEVTEDATYTAVYDDEQNEYTVIFQDEDGTVLESNYWYYGETPMYYGSEPSKEDNAEYSYYFAGWDKDIVAVTGDATYTAVYSSERNQYTITFQDEDGTELQSGLWYYGETPVYNGAELSQYSDDEYTYYFAGWDKDIVAVTEDATYTAVYTATEALPKDIVLQERESDEYYTQFAEDYDGVTVNTVTLNRQFSQGKWSTLCLPFNVNKAMFGTLNFGSRIYEFRYAAGDGDAGVSLFFSIAKSIEAGKGYIVNADAKLAARTSFVFPGVKIDLSADNGEELNSVAAYDNLEGSSAQGNIELVGTLRKGTLKGSSGDNRYMGLKDNKIYYPNTSSGSTIYAYRGIFRSQTGTLNAERIRIIVDGEDMGELRIDKGEMLMDNSSEPHKFIENGILYIERDGVIYNAQGQRVE